MVKIMENPIKNGMIWGKPPIFGNPYVLMYKTPFLDCFFNMRGSNIEIMVFGSVFFYPLLCWFGYLYIISIYIYSSLLYLGSIHVILDLLLYIFWKVIKNFTCICKHTVIDRDFDAPPDSTIFHCGKVNVGMPKVVEKHVMSSCCFWAAHSKGSCLERYMLFFQKK